jgi:hypothetical protein
MVGELEGKLVGRDEVLVEGESLFSDRRNRRIFPRAGISP